MIDERCKTCMHLDGFTTTCDLGFSCISGSEYEVKKSIGKAAAHDPVNHPAHYTDGKIEVIDFIDDKRLSFCRGNAVKYIARAGKKDPSKTVEDLKKAVWYLNHEIERIESNENH